MGRAGRRRRKSASSAGASAELGLENHVTEKSKQEPPALPPVAPARPSPRRRWAFILGIALGLTLPAVLTKLGIVEPPKLDHATSKAGEALQYMQSVLANFNATWNVSLELERWGESLDFMSSPLRPGKSEDARHLSVKHPVVIVPGFTSCGLEVWRAEECLASYFRQRIWGTVTMLQTFLAKKECWLKHMSLDRLTGLDPSGIKLRAASGLEAADYFAAGYWVWGKVIENLADIGYTSNEMFMAAYDWRLTPHLLEERDAYFSKLKSTIEVAHSSSNEKVLLLSHSYGSLMCQYFFNWVSSAQGAGADEDWVDAHVYAYSNIAGPMLGVPKAVSAMLSGQFRESAELGSLSKALDTFLSPEKRAELIRSWSSLWSMLPRGGDRIWGNVSHSPEHSVDGPSYWESMWAQAGVDSPPPKPGANFTGSASGEVIRFSTVDECDDSAGEEGVALARELEIDQEGARAVSCAGRTLNPSNLTAGQAVHQLIATRMPSVALSEWDDVIAVAAHVPDLRKNPKYQHARYFTNPLTSPLPSAPHMRIFCLYGVGQPAERNYMYKRRQDVENDSASVPYVMDNSITASGFRSGVQSVDGDGSVPLVSLGYMCVEGWKNAKYPFNPAKIPITTVEYLHMPQKVFDGRGGGSSANHVDIMGHNEMILHIMLMAAGHSEKVEERILSNVREMSANVNLLEGSSAPTWSDSFEASHFYRDEL